MISAIHHISLTTDDKELFEKAVKFYTEVLELEVYRTWETGIMIKTGSGYIEIFNHVKGEFIDGAVEHFALACDSIDETIEKVRKAGFKITKEPKDVVIPSEPPIPARIAFFTGPLGEKVELFFEK